MEVGKGQGVFQGGGACTEAQRLERENEEAADGLGAESQGRKGLQSKRMEM